MNAVEILGYELSIPTKFHVRLEEETELLKLHLPVNVMICYSIRHFFNGKNGEKTWPRLTSNIESHNEVYSPNKQKKRNAILNKLTGTPNKLVISWFGIINSIS